MLAPGSIFSSGRVDITAGAAQTPDFFNQGVGFMNDGTLAVDTGVPSGSNFRAGIRQSAAGAFYGTTTAAGTDNWVGGLRVSNLGQIVYEAAAAATFQNGDPATSNGRFATA